MGFRFRQSFRLWKGASVTWSKPVSSGKPGSGCGVLTLGALVVVVAFALLGNLMPEPPEPAPSPKVSRPPPTPALTKATPPISMSPVLNAEQPGPESSPPAPNPHVLTSAIEPDIGTPLSARSLFQKLDLVAKGFELTPNEHGNPPFWTFRKVEAQREYTAIAMGNDASHLTALTVEIIATDQGLNTFATTYFSAFSKAVVPAVHQEEIARWLKVSVGTTASRTIGELFLSLVGTGKSHRRFTIQPK